MRLKGKGVKILNKNSYGDLIVTVKIELPKSLDKKSLQLVQELEKLGSEKTYAKYSAYLDKTKN